MGYDLERFKEIPNRDLVICQFCGKVLEDALFCKESSCQHSFCTVCVNQEMTKPNPKCPKDKTTLKTNQLEKPPRLLCNLLAQLLIKCDNEHYGCQETFALDNIRSHQLVCPYHPDKEVLCERICGLKFKRRTFQTHDCIVELKTEILVMEERLQQKTQLIQTIKERAAAKKTELGTLSTEMLKSLQNLQDAVKKNP